MRKLFFGFLIAVLPVICIAGEINDSDIATYSLDGKNGQSTDMQIRLSRIGEKWAMEGKEGNAPWKNISCDRGCNFRTSSLDEESSYLAFFPLEMRERFDIACIQNVANAFCRLTRKGDPSKGGYALIALVSGKPIPMSLQRLTR